MQEEANGAEVLEHSEVVSLRRRVCQGVRFERVGDDESEGGREGEEVWREFGVEGEVEKLSWETEDRGSLLRCQWKSSRA